MAVSSRQLGLDGLRDVHESSKLGPYVRSTWARREYISYVARSELRGKQMNSVLGNLWYLLNPILQIAIYFLIFGLILEVDRGVDNFVAFLTVGTLLFTFIQRSALTGAKAITSNLGLIRAVAFPRVVLPLTTTATELLAALPSLIVLVLVSLVTGETPQLRWLLVLPIIATAAVFNAGIGMVMARAAARIRDVQQVLPFAFRLLFYSSGVLFDPTAYNLGALEWLFRLNPLYCILTTARWTILGGDLDPFLIISGCTWAIVAVTVGFWWFRRAEATYGRE